MLAFLQKKLNNMKYDFIEIGTSDFETLLVSTKGQIGLSIEPLNFYLDNLPDNNFVIKVNCAISDVDSIVNVFWVEPEDIIKNNLPIWFKGCNSINTPHSVITRELKEKNLEHLIKTKTCESITWSTLVKRYDIKNVDFLKIDTEGHDCVIINSILDNSVGVLPHKILFEGNELTPKETINKTIDRLIKHGYKLITNNGWDIIVEL
jgi:hypothetical protein